MKNYYISIAGVLGTGKSTAAKILAEELGYHLLEEPVLQNPFLDVFYKEPARWAFHTQMSYLSNRAEQLARVPGMLRAGGVVQDCPIYEDHHTYAVAQHKLGYLSEHELEIYKRLYEKILENLKTPDLVIQLDAPLEVIQHRVKKRGRNYEKSIDADYLKLMIELQKEWTRDHPGLNVLVLDWSRSDIINDPAQRKEFVNKVKKNLPK